MVNGGEVLLILTRTGRRWQLPRGHLEEGETPQQAAVREVREETGIRGRVLAPLSTVEYDYTDEGSHIHKRGEYFLLRYIDGRPCSLDSREVDRSEWFTWEAAIEKLFFDNERTVVREARELAQRMAL